jgi:glutamate racemase
MQPIVVIDSGLGGLLVAQSIQKSYPDVPLVYFGDTAHAPYGSKSADYLHTRVSYLFEKALTFYPQCIVIACNTLEAMCDSLICQLEGSARVVRIIKPTALHALSYNPKSILVLATQNTVDSGVYQKEIFAKRHDIIVEQLACPMFVEYIEGKAYTHLSEYELVKRQLSSFKDKYDVVILGCTHFPYFSQEIKALLKPRLALLDSTKAILLELQNMLKMDDVVTHPEESQKTTVYFSRSNSVHEVFAQKILGRNCVFEQL